MERATGSSAGGRTDGPEVASWVRRLAEMQQVVLDERQLGWWTVHLQAFLRYCRRRGERIDVRILARGSYEELRVSEPAVSQLLLRGMENWHWAQNERGEWAPRFRLRSATGPRTTATDAGTSSSPVRANETAACLQRHEWERALRTALRVRHYAIRTEQTYTQWARQFLEFHVAVDLQELQGVHVRGFLEHLALGRNVTASTQNQALSALLFFFRHVLQRDLGELGETVRARRGRKLPVVLSRQEVRHLLSAAEGTSGLMLRVIYGGGLRMMAA